MAILPAYRESFFCGQNRQDGPRLTIEYDGDIVYCHVYMDNRFEGYEDVVHGGMVMGILDTMMWYVIFMKTGKICMTRRTEMDFFKPVMCNTAYLAKAEFAGTAERDVLVNASMEEVNGEACAKVTAVFREAKDLSVKAFIDQFDFSGCLPEIRDYFESFSRA